LPVNLRAARFTCSGLVSLPLLSCSTILVRGRVHRAVARRLRR
jgi:hypothetical protein